MKRNKETKINILNDNQVFVINNVDATIRL